MTMTALRLWWGGGPKTFRNKWRTLDLGFGARVRAQLWSRRQLSHVAINIEISVVFHGNKVYMNEKAVGGGG